jgi:hypothetical protein
MKQTISLVVIGIILAAAGFFGVKYLLVQKKLKAEVAYSAGLKKQLDAPPTWSVKEIHDTVLIPILLHPTQPDSIVYVPVLLNSDCDSVKKDYYAKRFYSGDFKDNFIEGKYGVTVSENKLDKIIFPWLATTHTDSTGIKLIDTCFAKPPAYYARNHWWLYGKPQLTLSPVKIVNISAGGIYTFRDKWGIGAGVGYDWNINKPIADVIVLFNLK